MLTCRSVAETHSSAAAANKLLRKSARTSPVERRSVPTAFQQGSACILRQLPYQIHFERLEQTNLITLRHD